MKESNTVYTAFEKSYSLLLVLNCPLNYKEEGGGRRAEGLWFYKDSLYFLPAEQPWASHFHLLDPVSAFGSRYDRTMITLESGKTSTGYCASWLRCAFSSPQEPYLVLSCFYRLAHGPPRLVFGVRVVSAVPEL